MTLLSDAAPEGPPLRPARQSEGTASQTEIDKFSAMAEDWWNPKGKFAPLHRMNPIRLELIRDEVMRHFGVDPTSRRPFAGLTVLDLGCGGGLVTEPMARMGAAKVIGIDASEANINAARAHATGAAREIDYRVALPEELVAAGEPPADVVLALEIVEHVADMNAFLVAAASLLKPGGLMIISTINRTPEARAFALFAAERILRWLPPGTHDYDKLVQPEELREALQGLMDLDVRGPIGMNYSIFSGRWSLSADARINYVMTAAKRS